MTSWRGGARSCRGFGSTKEYRFETDEGRASLTDLFRGRSTAVAVMVAGAGSTGGILAVCIGKFRRFFRANRLGLFQKTKEK